MLLLDTGLARGRGAAAGAARRTGRWWRARRASSSATARSTGQDRWEENAGYTPFTLAVQVAALLAAAEIAEACDIDGVAEFLRDTADAWNEQIEDWIYVADTPLAREVGVAGYYVRIAPEVPGEARAELARHGRGAQPLRRKRRTSPRTN